MSLETEVAALTQATTDLLFAVNVRKAALDQAVADATLQAQLATSNGAAQVESAAVHAADARTQKDASTLAALEAAASALQAAAYASLAQATNPDSPIRLNPRRIGADFTVSADYNAASAGPLTLADGVTVTLSDNATWSIH